MQQQINPTMNIRTLALVSVAGAWLAGTMLASCILLPLSTLLVGIGVAIILIILCRHDKQARFLLLLVCSLVCGAWRYTNALPGNDPLSITGLIGRGSLTIKGIVSDEPKLQTRSRLLIITVESVRANSSSVWEDAHGQLEVQALSTAIEDPYGANYGDSVEVVGKLLAPWPHSPPDIFTSMTFPRIKVDTTGGNPVIGFLYHLRVLLASGIEQNLSQPEAALLIAILLGLHTPVELQLLAPTFAVTGTAHLLAPAGFKVTLLAGLVASSLRWLQSPPGTFQLPAERRNDWRHWLTTTCTIICITAYTMLNGAGPAALRAGIMGTISVIAPRLGRTYNVYTALALAALLLVLFDPFTLWDIGFQLSFLGTLGIVVLTPFFQQLLQPLERLPFGHQITEITAVTLAAQVATLPINAITFQQISFVAPLTNILTVPLLTTMISLGMLISISGLFFAPFAIVCGWIAWPVLWYVQHSIEWCASLPGAYISVNNVPDSIAWSYYLLLILIGCILMRKWPAFLEADQAQKIAPRLTTKTAYIVQASLAILVIISTGTAALLFQQSGSLTITFLNVAPAGQPSQGEAILIRTPDGKSALIDGGLDAVSLAQLLDSSLPSWQRSLNLVILTTPLTDHITGLQDIITRYTIDTVADAGMLHPNTTYARWRRTINERNLSYVALSQGMTIPLGTQVAFQVLWPGTPLQKSSNEPRDNSLVLRMLTPGLRMLFLGVSVQSKIALTGLTENMPSNLLQAEIVQVVSEMSKQIPGELAAVLQKAHPSLLVITPAALSPRQRKACVPVTAVPPEFLAQTRSDWQTVQTARLETQELEITSTASGWSYEYSVIGKTSGSCQEAYLLKS